MSSHGLVFAPTPLLTVTIESDASDAAELHVHAGGQGFWIARMMETLGLNTTLCGVFGGEAGKILRPLIEGEGVAVRGVAMGGENGSYVHDRRSGNRLEVVSVRPQVLTRHEVDDLFSNCLAEGLTSGVAALGGPHEGGVIPDETYGRLAADLTANGIPVVADLSGPTLQSALEGGLDILKVSHEDLVEDGFAKSEKPADLATAMEEFGEKGARVVVISRGEESTLAWEDGQFWEAIAPPAQSIDHRGAGDSMTAALAVSTAQGESLESGLRLAVAAGAATVTRRGLATGHGEVVRKLAERAEVRKVDRPGKGTS